MSVRDDDALSAEERARLAGLVREAEPGPEVEDAIVGVLRRERLLRPAPARLRIPLALAAALALFLAGVFTGQRLQPPAAAPARDNVAVTAADSLQTTIVRVVRM